MTDSGKIAIFGTGDFGKKAYKYFGEEKVGIFLDNNKEKQGDILFGVPIYSLEAFLPMKEEYTLVVAVRDNEDIIRQLISNEVTEFYTFLGILGHGLIHKVSVADWLLPKEEMRRQALMQKGKNNVDPNKWDICLTGLYTELNYGAELTCLALYTYLNSLGYAVLMNQPQLEAKVKPNRFPPLFRENPYPLYDLGKVYNDIEEMKELNKCAKFFVLGSDQMWNLELMRDRAYVSYMEFVEEGKEILSYATSFGKNSWDGDEVETDRMQRCLNRFCAISVRENSSIDMCKKLFGIAAEQCVDPVFLMGAEFYRELAEKSKGFVGENTITTYLFHDMGRNHNEIELFAKKRGAQINRIEHGTLYVEDWLRQIIQSKLLITNSFHGVCFAILFEIDFIVVEFLWSARIFDLLTMLGLEERIIKNVGELNEKENILEPIDYDRIHEVLKGKIEFSKKWLVDNIMKMESEYEEC